MIPALGMLLLIAVLIQWPKWKRQRAEVHMSRDWMREHVYRAGIERYRW